VFRKAILLVLFLNLFSCLFAQNYTFWVAFSDKKNSPYSLENPSEYLTERALQRRLKQGLSVDETDLPVNPFYVDSLKMLGATIIGTSRWLNGATFTLNDTIENLDKIRRLPFVSEVQLTKKTNALNVSSRKKIRTDIRALSNDSAYRQNDIHELKALHKLGFKGTGIHVAIVDAGFSNVDHLLAFDSLYAEGRLLGVRDFVDSSADVYRQHAHGLAVLSVMAANIPNVMVGSAPHASYWLLRTEDAATESLLELDNWVRAVEFADSVGVDVVNSSLGYSTFDDSSMNFSYSDMDGKTARISIAATMAARKGMLIVSSAGNDGSNAWHYISAPADADSIITVGGVNYSGEHCAFSSYGPTFDNRIKPTVCSVAYDTYVVGTSGEIYGGTGTSFASPIVAGAVACLWQALPNLTNMQIIELLKSNSSLSDTPNNVLGYGIPNLYQIYNNSILKIDEAENKNIVVCPNPFLEKLKISLLGESRCSIYDLTGECVFSSNFEGEILLNTNQWSKGFYVLIVISGNSVVVEKIVKK